jgi:hypothetical protein
MDGDVGSSLDGVHRTIHRRCLLNAKLGRIQGEQISSEMRSRAEIETGCSRSVSQKRRSTDDSDHGLPFEQNLNGTWSGAALP